MPRSNPLREIRTLLVMTLSVAIPVLLTHATVKVPVWERDTLADPTPRGYTVSLLIFVVPVTVVAVWHWLRGAHYDRKAFWYCAALMTTLGVVLDLAFGFTFFQFQNRGATLGIRLPSWDWANMAPVMDYLPVEEFGFYILGAMFMVAVYLWADLNWMAAYDPNRYEKRAPALPRIVEVSPIAVGVWLALLSYGIVHKYALGAGFPEYYTFLMAAGVLPSLFLVRAVKQFVNWHALGFAFGALVFVSVIWEASLGVPYRWWTYRDEHMLGWYFPAWGNLPVEAVILWLIGVWDAVMFYELFRIRHRMENRKLRHALFGRPKADLP